MGGKTVTIFWPFDHFSFVFVKNNLWNGIYAKYWVECILVKNLWLENLLAAMGWSFFSRPSKKKKKRMWNEEKKKKKKKSKERKERRKMGWTNVLFFVGQFLQFWLGLSDKKTGWRVYFGLDFRSGRMALAWRRNREWPVACFLKNIWYRNCRLVPVFWNNFTVVLKTLNFFQLGI